MIDAWRPDNWSDPYIKGRWLNDEEVDRLHAIYEDGANAMLRELRAMGKRLGYTAHATAVIIPDDKEEAKC